jgi:hypothetical protein
VMFPRVTATVVFMGAASDVESALRRSNSWEPHWASVFAAILINAIIAYLAYRGAVVVRAEITARSQQSDSDTD